MKQLPKAIWVLGFVSLFMDISSEIVHGLLPVFLISILGASYTTLGLIEGIGEGSALLFKILSGPVSDRFGNRKSLVLLGYSLSVLSKPLFAIAETAQVIFGARLFDRMGKGIRGAPRDAMIADITPPNLRGRAYGLRQALDTTGAFIGPLLAILLMHVLHDDIRLIFWIAGIPGIISIVLILFGVKEPKQRIENGKKLNLVDFKLFDRGFWLVCCYGGILQLARFSEAFLILRAQSLGLAIGLIPLALVVMNIVYSLSAYPIGDLSDRISRKKILVAGFGVLILADMVLAFGTNLIAVFVGISLWGLHLGMTQGLLATLVADKCPQHLRGSAFGVFNFVNAIALIVGGGLAGVAWDFSGPKVVFLLSAGFAASGLIALRGVGDKFA